MYEKFFGLEKKPFSLVPDPQYFYMSTGHREALAHLIYGINSNGGFVLLTGEVGTGKTTVCRRMIEMLPEDTEVAFILNPKLTVEELLATICDEFSINYPKDNKSIKVFVDLINTYLLKLHGEGKKAVLILEEAQNLTPEVLEQIRLLTNLETKEKKLLQMVLIGQPELKEMLSKPYLRQLSQRITARYHLGSLSEEEVSEYVNYRLSMAGLIRGEIFPRKTLKRLYSLSKGIPRLINIICDRALLGAYVQGKEKVDLETLNQAALEVSGENRVTHNRKNIFFGLPILGITILLIVLVVSYIIPGSGVKHFLSHYLSSKKVLIEEQKGGEGAKGPVKDTILTGYEGISTDETKLYAYETLSKIWNLSYIRDPSSPFCEQVKAYGLLCLQSRDSLNSLINMNRPAVLKFMDENNRIFYGTLYALKGERYNLMVGQKKLELEREELLKSWTGEYLLLWSPPEGYSTEFRPGAKGKIVEWLERQLAILNGKKDVKTTGIYKGELINQIKKLQLKAGITPDGIVGPKTLMVLKDLSKNDDPKLKYD
ncbi:MAG: AAA family ATPase [Syntrophorhabdaceae bacterium]|nr:AAA family ATPase [Syntrophorhabdaceae bacterium]